MSETELADEILDWYWTNKDKINKNKRFWAQNNLGYAIMSIAKEEKRWKNAPRGNPFSKKTLTPANDDPFDF